jgi:Protein of unknown function, DUF547
MSFLRFSKPPDENQPRSGGIVSLAVLIAVVLLVSVNAIMRLPMYVMSLFINVQHPVVYSFPNYAKLLPEVVKGDFVDYQALKKSKLLDEAMSDLGHTSPDSLEDSDQRFCFWLNSYNLLVLKSIADKYPIERLSDPRLSHMGTNKYFIGGKPYSIEEIRKMQLVPVFLTRWPMALFLACGGCIGSPPLLDHVITPKTLREDSESAAAKFVDKKDSTSYDPVHKAFMLSPFFMFNETVFSRFGGAHAFVNRLLPKAKQLDIESRAVLFKTYSQHLNMYINDTALQQPKGPAKIGRSAAPATPGVPTASDSWAKPTSNDTSTNSTTINTPAATTSTPSTTTTAAPATENSPTATTVPNQSSNTESNKASKKTETTKSSNK